MRWKKNQAQTAGGVGSSSLTTTTVPGGGGGGGGGGGVSSSSSSGGGGGGLSMESALFNPWEAAKEGDLPALQAFLTSLAEQQHQQDQHCDGDDDGDGMMMTTPPPLTQTPVRLWEGAGGFQAKGFHFGCTPLHMAVLGPNAAALLLFISSSSSSSTSSSLLSSSAKGSSLSVRQRTLMAAKQTLKGLSGFDHRGGGGGGAQQKRDEQKARQDAAGRGGWLLGPSFSPSSSSSPSSMMTTTKTVLAAVHGRQQQHLTPRERVEHEKARAAALDKGKQAQARRKGLKNASPSLLYGTSAFQVGNNNDNRNNAYQPDLSGGGKARRAGGRDNDWLLHCHSHKLSSSSKNKACSTPGVRCVEFVLQRCFAYVDSVDHSGRTPLMLVALTAAAADAAAADAGTADGGGGSGSSSAVAAALLRGGARVQAADFNGNSPLHYAFAFCAVAGSRASSRSGGSSGGSGSRSGSSASSTSLLSLLMAAGARPTAKNFAGLTPKDVLGGGARALRGVGGGGGGTGMSAALPSPAERHHHSGGAFSSLEETKFEEEKEEKEETVKTASKLRGRAFGDGEEDEENYDDDFD
jgi:hypothetical protein